MNWILLNKNIYISGSKGFGNTPISKENIGHKVLDIIDKAVNITDQRDEVMKMCLANSEVGDYQPVEVQGQPLVPFIYYISTFIAQNLIWLPNFSYKLFLFSFSFLALHFDEVFMLRFEIFNT